MPTRLRRALGGGVMWLAVVGAPHVAAPCAAQPASGAPEYEVKAAFLYNFARFATWPAAAFRDADAPLALCVAGDDPFGPALAALEGKPVGERRIAVRLIAPADWHGCHLLFVAHSAQDRFAELAEGLADRYLLTVGDTDGFATRGGVINFVLDGERVRFEVNLAALERSGVALSSHVLRLARIVGGK